MHDLCAARVATESSRRCCRAELPVNHRKKTSRVRSLNRDDRHVHSHAGASLSQSDDDDDRGDGAVAVDAPTTPSSRKHDTRRGLDAAPAVSDGDDRSDGDSDDSGGGDGSDSDGGRGGRRHDTDDDDATSRARLMSPLSQRATPRARRVLASTASVPNEDHTHGSATKSSSAAEVAEHYRGSEVLMRGVAGESCQASLLMSCPSSFFIPHPSSLSPHPSLSLILHPSALTLHSSFFILHPSCFIPHSSSFIFRGVMLCADAVSLYRRRAMSPLPAFMGSGASDTASVGRDSAAGGTTVKLVHGRQSPALRGRTHVNAPSPDTIVASVSLSLLPARCETFRFGCALRG